MVRKMRSFFAAIAVVALSLSAGAQDVAKVNPDTITVKIDNARARFMEAVLEPGHKEAMHSHPASIVYVLAGGTTRSHRPDGTSSVNTWKAGDVVYREALTHWAENIGDTTIRLLVIELKTPCDMNAATPWITKWFDAWRLTTQEILHIDGGKPPELVFFDANCVYTTSPVSGADAPLSTGPDLLGTPLPWRTKPHGGTLTMPNGTTLPVALMSFASGDPKTGPYFVMAAPDYWAQSGHPSTDGTDFTPVFLHEFSHVRQVGGFPIIGEIEKTWKFKDEFDDDMVQHHFKSNAEYVKAFEAERDLLFRAAAAESDAEVRSLATEALKMIKARHARWFTGDEAVFAKLDSVWLSMEGSGQWIGYAWLAHPKGGALQQAIDKMRGRKHAWSQDEGLGLFLVVDRLLPSWPQLVFRQPSIGAVELLERAIQH